MKDKIDNFVRVASSTLEELRKAYLEGGLDALRDYCQRDYGVGRTEDGQFEAMDNTPENAGRFIVSFADLVYNTLEDIRNRYDFNEEEHLEQIANETWSFYDWTDMTPQELIEKNA